MNVAREAKQREWIWEFFLKNCTDGRMIQGLLNALPFPDDNSHVKRLLFLRLLSFQMAEGAIDDLTLDILRSLGKLCGIVEGSHPRESVSDDGVCYVEKKRRLSEDANNEPSVQKKRKLSETTSSSSPVNLGTLQVLEEQCMESCEVWLARKKPGLPDDVEEENKKMEVQNLLNTFLARAWAATGQTVLERVSTDVVNGTYNPVNSSGQRNKRTGFVSEDGERNKETVKVKCWNRSSRLFSRSREKLQKTFGNLESEFEVRNQDEAHSDEMPIATGDEKVSDDVETGGEHFVTEQSAREEREGGDEAGVTGKLPIASGDDRVSDCVETGGERHVPGESTRQERDREDEAHETGVADKLPIAKGDERTGSSVATRGEHGVTGDFTRKERNRGDEAHEAVATGKLPISLVHERAGNGVETRGERYVTGETTRHGSDGTTNVRTNSGLDCRTGRALSPLAGEGLGPPGLDVGSTKVGVGNNGLVVNLLSEFEKANHKSNRDGGRIHEGAQEIIGGAKKATGVKDQMFRGNGNRERVLVDLDECSSETCSMDSKRAPRAPDFIHTSEVRETSTNGQGTEEAGGRPKSANLQGAEPVFLHQEVENFENVLPPLSPQPQDEIQKDPNEVCFSPPPWVTRPSSPAVQAKDTVAEGCNKQTSQDAGPTIGKEDASSAETGDFNLETTKVRENLKRKQTALDAAVQDPLPRILTRSRGRRGIMEPNPTARTFQWDDEEEDDIEYTPSSPSASRRVQLPRAVPTNSTSPSVGAAPKNNISPLVGTKAKSKSVKGFQDRRRIHRRWSAQEVDALKVAVNKYGKGRWKLILKFNEDIFQGRTEVDLKDKWRNLERYEGIKVKDYEAV